MENILRYGKDQRGITSQELDEVIEASVSRITGERKLHRILILPPDYTRLFSGAGMITAAYYKKLSRVCPDIDVMPAIGTHEPMRAQEIIHMFGGVIPPDKMIRHRWREDVVQIGQIPKEAAEELSGGIFHDSIKVEVNSRLTDPSYDLILSIGQVVPHEVAGMANYSKNIFVGCGGAGMISQTHILGALCGVEHVIGKADTPVRRVFDYGEEHFLKNIPILYVLTVSGQGLGESPLQGIFVGRGRELFAQAAQLSLGQNVTYLPQPADKIVAYMDGEVYQSTWVANKAIYRTKLALKPGGELIIIASGVKRFGEDPENDRLIREIGYRKPQEIKQFIQEGGPLAGQLSAAAHLLQGSPEGIQVTYAVDPGLKEEMERVRYQYMPLQQALEQYQPAQRTTGWYWEKEQEAYYFIRHPASGLWVAGEPPKQGEEE